MTKPISARRAAEFVVAQLGLGDVLDQATERDDPLSKAEGAALRRALTKVAEPKLAASLAELLACAKLVANEVPTATGAQPRLAPPTGRVRMTITSVVRTTEPPATLPTRGEHKAGPGRPNRQALRRLLDDIENLVTSRVRTVAREGGTEKPRVPKVIVYLFWLYGIDSALWPNGRPTMTSAQYVDATAKKIDKLLRRRTTQR